MIRRFFDQSYLYHKGRRAAFEAEEFVLMQIGYPLLTLIFYCLIASYSFHTTNLTSWVIGNAFLLCTHACIFGLGNIFVGERYHGRLRSIIASPCAKLPLILASGIFPALFAVCASVCGFIVGAWVFGVDFSGVHLGFAALTILCAMASATCFGLFLSVFGLMSDSMHLVLNVVSYLMMIFTGAEFPLTQLPLSGRVIAQLMPLTKAIAAMNTLFGPEQGQFWTLLLAELATGAAYALLARAVFGFAERSARRNGRFDLF
ncbi:MAG: ABC transporter permease [Clostridia bacterium]|nr:ABC transporter permease [Clostridia bacterium]